MNRPTLHAPRPSQPRQEFRLQAVFPSQPPLPPPPRPPTAVGTPDLRPTRLRPRDYAVASSPLPPAPCSLLRAPCPPLPAPCSALHAPCPLLCAPRSALRAPCSALFVLLLCLGFASPLPAWETAHGDAAFTGQAVGSLPARPDILWRHAVGAPVSIPCLIGQDKLYAFSDRGDILCLSLAGERLWRTTLAPAKPSPTTAPTSPRPERLAAAGVIVARGVAVATARGSVALLAADDGRVLWRRDLGTPIVAALNAARLDDGREILLVMAQANGTLFAMAADDGRELWQSAPVGRSDCPAATAGGRVVFGSCLAALHQLELATGKSLGDIKLGDDCQIAAGASLADGHALAGNRSGQLVAANLETRTVRWQADHPGRSLFTTPTLIAGRVVFGADNGQLACLEMATGKEVWNIPLLDNPSSAAAAGDRLAVTDDGTLFVIALEDGRILWRRQLADHLSPPAARHGRLVVGTDEGEILMLGDPTP